MTINKHIFYLSASLFSTIILAPLATQPVKAASTTTENVPSNPVTSTSTSQIKANESPTVASSTTLTGTSTQKDAPTTSSTINSVTEPTTATTKATVTGTQSAPVTSPETTSATTPATQTITTTNSTITMTPTSSTTSPTYQVPQNLPDNTVINFSDPLLENVVKEQLQLPPNSPITAGKIRAFNSRYFGVSVNSYQVGQTHMTMNDQQSTPIENLSGMQYLQLLPTQTSILFQARMASDSKANTDLTPLDQLKFSSLSITGNFSNPNAKQIDVNQLTKLNVTNASSIDLNGDSDVSYGSGITNQQLQTIGPWLVNYGLNNTNKTANQNTIELGNSNITDFTPLKGLENGSKVIITADTPVHLDYTPIYAVDNQPITFTAKPVLGLDDDTLDTGYHFSNSVPQQYLTEEDLTNLGNGNYRLDNPAPGAQVLTYGYLGFGYSSNPDNFVNKTYGNATLQYYILNGQPIIWQKYPNVIVNYLNSRNQPLEIKAKTINKLVSGTAIGEAYDLTPISQVPGYKLTSPLTLLKGTFTQNPQIINLIYTPVINTTNSSSSSNESDTNRTKGPLLPVYDKNGQLLVNKYLHLTNQLITASIHKNNQTFYKISDNKWILSSDFYAHKLTQKNIRTFSKNTALVNTAGKVISTDLAPNSEWRIIKTVTIAGQKYYEVAQNEFLLATNTVEFTLQTTKLHLTTMTPVYNALGQPLTVKLFPNSNWSSDGFAIINNQKMYRIADDEWVPANCLYLYQPVDKVIHITTKTARFNLLGKQLPQVLKINTAWKVDQIVTIDGAKYYRIATDEFIKA
ncbi:SLAP domain-containing protein [Companilactobacillus zhachilii]|uniref:SLAP domain-containing protein n=1 Tax=Companilactobacillus zhachilii TaxID=2304606 RepID=UPI004034E3F7